MKFLALSALALCITAAQADWIDANKHDDCRPTQVALAAAGLLRDSACSAVFVGARWRPGEESPLSRGTLGAHFGARLTVTGFEADAAECARQNAAIAARPAELRLGKEVCVGAFLSDAARAGVPFYATLEPLCSSLLPPNARLMTNVGLEQPRPLEGARGESFRCGTVARALTVDTSTLDDHVQPGSVDYLRVDVQGADLAIIKGGAAALSNLLGLQVEVLFGPIYEGTPLFAARQDSAEHFFRSSALHYTATARVLIPAQCSLQLSTSVCALTYGGTIDARAACA